MLSYTPIWREGTVTNKRAAVLILSPLFGARGRDRTADTRFFKPVLYL